MDYDEVNRIIRRAFRKRGSMGICALLYSIRESLRRPSGWAPTIDWMLGRAQHLGLRVTWKYK